MKNNTKLEVEEIFRNKYSGRLFIHLRNPETGSIESYEVVDLPADHVTSYSKRKARQQIRG
jgi:hypothetical protein